MHFYVKLYLYAALSKWDACVHYLRWPSRSTLTFKQSIWNEAKFMVTIFTLVFHAVKSVAELATYWNRHPFTTIQSFDYELMTLQYSSHHLVFSIIHKLFSPLLTLLILDGTPEHNIVYSNGLSTVCFVVCDTLKYTRISWKSINTSALENHTEL